MTIDDESSIYVGGLPYDASEDSIRRVFEFYGSVVAVKIINDRGIRGKCYGFVTFTNPRSAIDAMEEMDGRTIGGRVVRVNGVRTRGGRSNFDGESFRHDIKGGREWDRDQDRDRGRRRDQDRERDYDHNQERYRDRSGDRSRDRDWSRDCDGEEEKGYDNVYADDQARDSSFDRDRKKDRDREDAHLEHNKNRDLNWERDRRLDNDRDREMDRTSGHLDTLIEADRDQYSRKWNGSNTADRHSGEFLPYPNDDSGDLVEEQLQRSIQRLDELNKEILQKQERLEEKEKLVLDLQQKSKELEDALINAKKTSSYRKRQLIKLHKSFLQVQEYTEKLRSCEKELQSLVDVAMSEEDIGDGALWAGTLANGNIA